MLSTNSTILPCTDTIRPSVLHCIHCKLGTGWRSPQGKAEVFNLGFTTIWPEKLCPVPLRDRGRGKTAVQFLDPAVARDEMICILLTCRQRHSPRSGSRKPFAGFWSLQATTNNKKTVLWWKPVLLLPLDWRFRDPAEDSLDTAPNSGTLG